MGKPHINVFISYAHKDNEFFEVFTEGLKSHLYTSSNYDFGVWEDSKIYIGSFWDSEIQTNLATADLAILCVSSHFLNSRYIEAKEFGALIEKFNNTLIIPVYFNHCSITVWDELSKRQFFKPTGKKYGKPADDDFSFCDIVEFASSEGRFIPKPYSKRDLYFLDLVAKIEESLGHLLRAPKVKEALFKTDGKYINPTNYPYFEKDSFFGRAELLKEIDDKLKTLDVPLLLSGIGGMGKTAVAVAYGKTNSYSNSYNHIAWVDVNENIFDNLFSTFHGNRFIPFEYSADVDKEKDKAYLFDLLKNLPGENLLLIDNANDDKDLGQFIAAWKQNLPGWKTLITTRCNNTSYKNHLIELQVISLGAAEELFKSYNDKKFDINAFREIYEYIGGHTFLIELLAKFSYVSNTMNSTSDILVYLKKRGVRTLTWTVDAKQTQKQESNKKISEFVMDLYNPLSLSEREQEYMRYFSILPPSEIKFKSLIDLFGIDSGDEEIFNQEINSLAKKGWLIKHADNFKCHQIIQEICREKLKPDGENCDILVKQLANLFGQSNTTQAIPFFEIGFSVTANLKVVNFEFASFLLNFSDRVKETGNFNNGLALLLDAKALFSQFDDENSVAICLERMGSIYLDSGNRNEALNCYKEFNVIEKSLSDNNPDNVGFKNNLAISHSYLGDFYRVEGNMDEALKCYKEAMTITKVLSDDNPDNLDFKNSLGISYERLGNFYKDEGNKDEALKCYKQYNAIEKFLSENDPGDVLYLNNLGISYSKLGDLYINEGKKDEALKYYKEAMRITKILSDDNPDNLEFRDGLAISHEKQGALYRDEGKNDEALNCYKEFNAIEKFLSEKSPDNVGFKNRLAISYERLGDIYRNEGKNDEALNCYKEFNAIEKSLSEKNTDNVEFKNILAISYSKLGDFYKDEGKNDVALNCYKEYNDIEKSLSEKKPDDFEIKNDLALSYEKLGNLYINEGKNDEALNCYKEFNAIEKYLSEKDPEQVIYASNLAISYSKLADLYRIEEKNNDALNCYKELNTINKSLSEKHPDDFEIKNDLALSYREMGDIYRDEGKNEDALNCYKEYNDIEKFLSEKNTDDLEIKNDLALSYEKLGNIYRNEGKNEDALNCYKEYNAIEKYLSEKDPEQVIYASNLAISYGKLADLYRDEEKNDEALNCYKELNSINKSLSEKQPDDVEIKNDLALSYNEMGDIYDAKGNRNEALNCYNEATRITKFLLDNNPDNIDFKNNLTVFYEKLGGIYKDEGKNDESLICFKQLNAIEKSLSDNNPDNLDYKNNLAISYTKLSSVSTDNEKKEFCAKAKKLWEELIKQAPENTDYKENLDWVNDELNKL